MAVTATYTYREICENALRKIGVIAKDEAAEADDIDTAVFALNIMLKAWQNYEVDLFLVASQSVTLTTAASYTLSPVRPLSISQVNYKSGTETPMTRMTREEYDSLPDKTTTGTPTTFYYDRQRESAKLYIWPVMASVTTETLEVTYIREVEDASLETAIDIPGEWYLAAVYGLADLLVDDYNIKEPRATRIERKAARYLSDALAFDNEGSVTFYGYDE